MEFPVTVCHLCPADRTPFSTCAFRRLDQRHLPSRLLFSCASPPYKLKPHRSFSPAEPACRIQQSQTVDQATRCHTPLAVWRERRPSSIQERGEPLTNKVDLAILTPWSRSPVFTSPLIAVVKEENSSFD